MKKIKNGKIWFRSLIVAFICFLITVILYFAGVFVFFENKTYDQRMVYASKYKFPDDRIFFVEVDQESIDWARDNYGWGWPWPREAYSKMVEFVSAGNASSIAFDIIYSEPSIYGKEDDFAFAQAEAESGIVIQTVFLQDSDEENYAPQFPVDEIKNNAAILGSITSLMDSDDVIRRGRLEQEIDGIVYPSLGMAPLYLEGLEEEIKKVPRQKDGSVLLRYQRNLNDFFPVQAYDIFESYDAWKEGEEGFYTPEDFEGGYIFVAYYAPGLFDICSTPVSQVFPGVGVHMTTLDNYLTDSFIYRVPQFIVVLWILITSVYAALVVAFASCRNHQRTTVIFMASGFILGVFFVAGIPYLLFIKGIWLQLIAPATAFLLSFIICVTLSLTLEGKQKRFIKSAFSQCLSKDVVNQICENPESFTLGGKKYDMSAIFTDIQKFSSFSELLTAAQLGEFLNLYLTKMSDIIMEEGGTIDKYEGDAIVALMGAPLELSDHASRSCAVAIKMKKEEVLINKQIAEIAASEKPSSMNEDLYAAIKILGENKKIIFTRIGINSGEMIAGYFGSENKKNYTMMGNNVNLASRLEGVNKQYKTGGILISEATRNMIDDRFVVRSLDRVRVVNVNTPIRLYELLEEKSNVDSDFIDYVASWEKGMKLFEEERYEESLELFRSLYAKKTDDNVAAYYIHLLEKYFVQGKYPVESDDEGVVFNPEDKVFRLLQK